MPDRVRVAEPHAGRFQRGDALRQLASEQFDLLVIGGGITGAGVALDAASRGLRTALVEKDDFASGTSSKSSKMVHGGLRYLQQREYRLVYENLAERQRLLDNAPHLVTPLPFLIPLFGKDGVVNRSVARVYLTALWLYDLTGGIRIGRRHEKVSRAQALAHIPTLRADHLVAGFLYWDASADDARLTLAVIRTAVLDHGAVAANHTPVVALNSDPTGRVVGATVAPLGSEPFDVRASVVVNAAGVWADEVRALDENHNPHSIRPAKGIHVTMASEAFPCDIAAVIPVKHDHRSIFVVSWGEQVYLGTTDTAWDGPLDDPDCTPEDVDYLLDAANAVTTRPLRRSDITGLWSGLRPLLAPVEDRSAPSERTADLSRRHTVRTSPGGGRHRHRRQTHHLPEDGRGHRRRRGEGPGPPVAPVCDQGPAAARGDPRRPHAGPARGGRAGPGCAAGRRGGGGGRPPGPALRDRDPRGAVGGRRRPGTARTPRPGAPLPRGGGPLRGPGGDGLSLIHI